MTKNVIGKRIREARYRLDLTQAELAARLQVSSMNISRGGIAKIEAGLRQVTDLEVEKFAEVLNVSPNWLFSRD